jgi:NitT/TauT family transport system substrate-binding protein
MSNLGKLVFLFVIAALLVFGYQRWGAQRGQPTPSQPADSATSTDSPAPTGGGADLETVAPLARAPDLPPAQAYLPKDGVLDVELSEYAGYAGLIVANGGLAPNEQCHLFKTHGLKLRITLSEEDSWPKLQSGALAATSTTVDVLPLYGRRFETIVPALISISRGADGVVTRKDIKRINDLKGKVLAAAQMNETEFFLRYLAQEASLPVTRLDSLRTKPDPNAVNLVFFEDAFSAGDAFLADLAAGGPLAGCVTWEPKTSEVVAGSEGKAHLLIDNRNLLVIADVLLVNKGLARAQPKLVEALVDGLLWGNAQVRDTPAAHRALLARAFKWPEEQVTRELTKVHLANLPENQAFFSGSIDAAGSFDSIYQSSVLAYGPEIVPNPPGSEFFHDGAALGAAAAGGAYAGQTVSIQPIKSGAGSPIENDPLLTRDIRFLFQPNSDALDMTRAENGSYLESIRKMLAVSPGSIILLQGHVDDAMVADFRKQGGDGLVRQMALKAMELSKNRALSVRKELLKIPGLDAARVEAVGRGWEDPKGLTTSEEKRRVEVLWYTVE